MSLTLLPVLSTRSTSAAAVRPNPLESVRSWVPSPVVGTVAVAAASIATASATVFARGLTDAGVAPATVALSRYGISAVVLLPCLRLTGPKARATAWGLLAGAMAGLGWIAYVASIATGDLALVGVSYMTYPVFTLAVLHFAFRSRATHRAVVAAVLVLLAAAVALGPSLSAGFSPMFFIAPATFGFGVAVLTERLRELDPFERLAAVSAGATLVLAPVVMAEVGISAVPTDLRVVPAILGIGVGCALIPMTIYGAAAPAIGGARSAMAGAVELPTVFLIGAFVYDEAVRIEHLVAAVIIVAAISLTPSGRTIHVLAEDDEIGSCAIRHNLRT